MKQATLTLSQFAHDLGAHQRITRTVSLVWHKQYVKANTATKQAMREEFVSAFLAGYGVRNLTAENRRNAEMAANQKFKYHISRDGAKSQPAQAKQISQRVAPAMRSAAMAFLAEFDGESLEEQIKQALIVLRAL